MASSCASARPARKPSALLDQIGAAEDDRRADARPPAPPSAARRSRGRAVGLELLEVVVLERQREIVGPVGDERGPHRHPSTASDQAADHAAVGGERGVLERVGLAARAARRAPTAAPPACAAIMRSSDEGDHGRHQQHEADHGAHLEVLLADHLLVGVGGEHVELAADHLGDAEVGDDQREHDERRARSGRSARRAASRSRTRASAACPCAAAAS